MSIATFDTLSQPNGSNYNIYSPDVAGDVMYLGGWRSAADIGPDILYQSPVGIDDPRPLNWIGAAPVDHVNDPSVIRLSASTLVMYVTVLPNHFAVGDAMFDHNVLGHAISTNSGISWTWAGLVIDQWNGFDHTGAWSPSAVETAHGPVVWYNTNWHDTSTGEQLTTRVYRSELNASGSSTISTVPCIRADTGTPLLAANVSVVQNSDGTYWMVGNDFNIGYSLVAYNSPDGVNWSPWSSWGDSGLIYSDGATLLTPTILSANDSVIELIYSEKLSDRSVQHYVKVQTDDYAAPNFLISNVFDGHNGQSLTVPGKTYTGPVGGINNDLIQITANNLNVIALTDGVFICSGSGNDALLGKSGYNVLDGGSGSNLLIAGSGRNTFFSHANAGVDTWSTIGGFRPGLDDVTIWDLLPGIKPNWLAGQGAAGFQGATLHIADATGHLSSLTLAGYSVDQANQLALNVGVSGGHHYVNLQ